MSSDGSDRVRDWKEAGKICARNDSRQGIFEVKRRDRSRGQRVVVSAAVKLF